MIEEKFHEAIITFGNNADISFKQLAEICASICKSEIAEACKKQREICAKSYQECESDNTTCINLNCIRNAPSPLDEVRK